MEELFLQYHTLDLTVFSCTSTIVDDGGCDETVKEVQRAHLTR